MALCNYWSQLKDSINGGSRQPGSVSCLLFLCFLLSSYFEFLWAVGPGWDDLRFIQGRSQHRAAGNSSPRHTDKWQPGSGSRMKLSCLNRSLERQPELFRYFHSASGRDGTRKVRAEETGDCWEQRKKGRGAALKGAPQRVPPGHPWPTICLWSQRSLGPCMMLAHIPGWFFWNSSFVLHRAGPHSQEDSTFMCNPGKRGSTVVAITGA